MKYELILVPGVLSYSGLVEASQKDPIVSVESKEIADAVVDTGYFKLLNSYNENEEEAADSTEASSFFNGEKYTEAELKKLSKTEQEDVIIKLADGNEVPQTKNESERITLILQLQEQEA
ncbi:hypothetical protein FKQ51_20200 [Bacillus toyonensis]|uniref:hypothetical protein n=1 Tax=Bacillus toyonensis TaxID=155322 RepID=UPI0026F7DD04|nr:hypothetical protein [Bacillus toyonensis]MDO8159633.1 hypothetical protein [Bacillus toyonensis]